MSTTLFEHRQVYALTLEDGRSFVFDVDALRQACTVRKPYLVQTPPNAYGIEPARLQAARDNRDWFPIIIALIDGKAYVLDGQHRVAVALDEGHEDIVAHVFTALEWPQFVLPVEEGVAAAAASLGDAYRPKGRS